MGHFLAHKCCAHSAHCVITIITIGSTIQGEDVTVFGKEFGKGNGGKYVTGQVH